MRMTEAAGKIASLGELFQWLGAINRPFKTSHTEILELAEWTSHQNPDVDVARLCWVIDSIKIVWIICDSRKEICTTNACYGRWSHANSEQYTASIANSVCSIALSKKCHHLNTTAPSENSQISKP